MALALLTGIALTVSCGEDSGTPAPDTSAIGDSDSTTASGDMTDDSLGAADQADAVPADDADSASAEEVSRPDTSAEAGELVDDTSGAELATDGDPLEVEDVAAEVETLVPTPWRSSLYPTEWAPGYADPSGAGLQDYSFAGYHSGALPLGDGLGDGGRAGLPRFDVTDFGAVPATDPADPAATASDSTAAFQAAINAAAAARGGLVQVPAGIFRIDGLLTVSASRVVLAGEGALASRLWFTRQDVSYGAHLRFGGSENVTSETPLARDAYTFDTVLEVADAAGFAIGDDVLVGQTISDAFIAEHGMTGTWQAFNGTWQAFFRRSVVAVDVNTTPPRVTLDVPLRSTLAVVHGASLRRVTGTLHEVGMQAIGVANAGAWEAAWAVDQINVVMFEHVADAWISGVDSFVSPGAPASGMGAGAHLQANGILVSGSKRVTVADSHLAKAQNRGSGGNGYLFEVRQSSDVLTRDCSAREGRHNFIQNWGFGTTGCVWLRVSAADGAQVPLGPLFDTAISAPSEYHHSLATANLVDDSTFDDGFKAENRGSYSTGAGHTASECVFWNIAGFEVVSLQYGRGYVIGSAPGMGVSTSLGLSGGEGSAPEDWVEGRDLGPWLEPGSLYEDQLRRRLGGEVP